MSQFAFHLPTRIIFGQPAEEALLAELAALGAKRVVLVSDSGLAEQGLVSQFQETLEKAGFQAMQFLGVTSNPNTDEVAAGLEIARQHNANALIALGGGSPIDVAKGIAMLLANGGKYADYQWNGKPITKHSLPVIAIPTTAGTGSEVSHVAVISDPENPFKKGVLSPLMFTHAAVVDPVLTLSLPPRLTAATGMDAFIHALEAYIGRRANPFTDQLALGAMETIWAYLPRAVADGSDIEAREKMMLSAVWGGIAMDQAGLGLVHALSGPLTTHLHLHHGLANALILPYVLRYNLSQVQAQKIASLKTTVGLKSDADDEALVGKVEEFVDKLGMPASLSVIGAGMDTAMLKTIAEETTEMVLIRNNPRSANAQECEMLLEAMK